MDEADIIDLSMDLNAVALDAEVSLSDLDESGMERVPMADPGMDTGSPTQSLWGNGALNHPQRPLPDLNSLEHSPGGANLHSRRKSALPGADAFRGWVHRIADGIHGLSGSVDPTVLRDLQAHRSLDDAAVHVGPPQDGS